MNMSHYSQKRKYSGFHDDNTKRSKPENELIRRVQSQPGIRGKLVFVYLEDDNPYTILQAAADAQKAPIAITARNPQNSPCIYELKIDNEVIVCGEFQNIAAARKELSRLALKNLQYTCFSVIKKQSPNGRLKVGLTPDVFEKPDDSKKGQFDSNSEAVVNSIGARMMKLMGWTGGGLGSQEQGDKNLIMPAGQNDRRGLGQKLPSEIKELLMDYSRNDDIDSLAFSDKFSKEQRALIHSIAAQCGLKSKSYGKDENRMLVIRKKLNPWQMVHRLLEVGGETVEHKLLLPLNEECNDDANEDS